MLADLEKTATILESHLGSSLGLRLLGKNEVFQFFSYLFNLEEWVGQDQLRSDTGVDRQIVNSPVSLAQRPSSGRQTPCPDVLPEDDARGIETMPLLRSVHARLRQCPVFNMAREVHISGAERDRRPGEVHLVLQGWRPARV